MPIETLRIMLGWCSVINLGLLIWWFLGTTVLHNLVYKIHSKFYKISVEKFDEIHYFGTTFFRAAVFFLNIVPYVALTIMKG
ncbi:MAG: hypothetical protein P9L90_03420 [Candidatus Aadella gelida]|nr:hypothetical protein [Candidatus Aadella gelida]